MLRTKIATTVAEIDELAPAWEGLFQPRYQTFFQQFVPNRLAAAYFGDRETPYVVYVEGDSSAAIVPAAICHHTGCIKLMGDCLFDYRDTLALGSPAALEHAWRTVASLERPLSVVALRPEAQTRWMSLPVKEYAKAPAVLRSDLDADTFRATHNKLGMLFRRLVRQGVFLRVHSGSNTALVRTIYELKAARFSQDPKNVFLDPVRRDFMVACCAALEDDCQVFTLQHDATRELVAALVTFRDEQARRFYTIYFDPRWAKFSPGIVLVYEATARSLSEDLDCDYMTGEYPYKNRLATALPALSRVDAEATELMRTGWERASTAA